jgi:hypothetical protein
MLPSTQPVQFLFSVGPKCQVFDADGVVWPTYAGSHVAVMNELYSSIQTNSKFEDEEIRSLCPNMVQSQQSEVEMKAILSQLNHS